MSKVLRRYCVQGATGDVREDTLAQTPRLAQEKLPPPWSAWAGRGWSVAGFALVPAPAFDRLAKEPLRLRELAQRAQGAVKEELLLMADRIEQATKEGV